MSFKKVMKPVLKAGFVECDATAPSGMTIHYARGGNASDNVLLLIHGQTGAWQDYASVLPELSKQFEVFAIDCPGHGKSGKLPERYKAKYIGEDLAWFIKEVIGRKCYVSGHSSGGLLTAWLAANSPDLVKAVLLEDPPFYSTEKGERWEKSFAYVDTYEPMHRFLNQSEEKDWLMFYLENAAWGKFVGEKTMAKLVKMGRKYRAKHPGKPLHYFFLPDSINHMFWFIDDYDLRFGDMFYDSTWFEDFDQSEVLSRITCPAVLIHNTWSIDDNGILMAAMSGDDAEKANSLMKNSEIFNIISGHDSHVEKPMEFINAMCRLYSKTEK